MTTALATRPPLGAQIEQVLVGGNLAGLSPEQRVSYYNAVCESVGLNPLTRPFEYITLNNKLVLYARRDCTDQLRKIHGVSIKITARELVEGVYIVTAGAVDRGGRSDESTGAVPLDGLKGEARANAMMKAETKAKRRVTLSVCGLGMLDENEVDSIPGATLPALVTGPAGPPVATSGTAHLPKREDIHGFDDPADEEEQRLNAEYTEPVPVYDPDTGEQARSEPKITTAQNQKIHALLRDVRNQYPEQRYRVDIKKKFHKEHTNELSTREASRVIEVLLRRYEKVRPTLEAQEREHELARQREAEAAAAAPVTDIGEAPPDEAVEDLRDLFKRLGWKRQQQELWAKERFGVDPEALTAVQLRSAFKLLLVWGTPERYQAALKEEQEGGRCK